nr:DUF4214 domain-containing protein [Thiospirillum jenense]
MVRVGDIDNLGFGWPLRFDPFSGEDTPVHAYPWVNNPLDAPGTDRISVISSYSYVRDNTPCGRDGYTSNTLRPGNVVIPIALEYASALTGITISSAALQLFVDDFQAPYFCASYRVKINGVRIPILEAAINSLVQTGPIGKLITVPIPQEYLYLFQSGAIAIEFDDVTTGAGDGYAVDFIKLLINPTAFAKTGTITGTVIDESTRTPIGDCQVSTLGNVATLTDAEGHYTLTDVPAGFVALKAFKPGYTQDQEVTDLIANAAVEVHFALNIDTAQYAINVTAQPIEGGTIEGAGDYTSGDMATVHAIPNPGWQFMRWWEENEPLENTPLYEFTVVEERALIAEFIPSDHFNLTVIKSGNGKITSEPSGIDCGTICNGHFAAGSVVELSVTPDDLYRFANWDGACHGSLPTCTVTLDQAQTVLANFRLMPFAMTVIGSGSVTSEPTGIECDSSCVGYFAANATVIFTATAAANNQFIGWDGACADFGTAPTCELTLNKAQSASVKFESIAPADQYELTTVVIGNGVVSSESAGIDCDANCSNYYAPDTLITLTATPGTDAQFIGWGGACTGNETNCTITLNESLKVVALFNGTVFTRESLAWQVTEIYIATQGYAPDNEGLQYWVNRIETDSVWNQTTVAQSFFDQPLVTAKYPESDGYGRFIDALYRNLFGRGADTAGYNYWLERLESSQFTRNQMIITLLLGGWDNPSPDAQADMTRFAHRVEVGLAFADYQAQHGIVYGQLTDTDQAYLRQVGYDILLNVTADPATRDAAIATIPTLLSPLH